jgi:hypothetical protein
MEAIAQFLSSLKENEKSIIITIIANALTIYMLCFVGIEEFKTYLWYQQIIIPCSLSIAYTTTFYSIIISILGIFFIFKGCRDICSFMMEDNYKWFFCIFSLANCSTLLEVASTLIDKSHLFCIFNIARGTGFVILGFMTLLIIKAIIGFFVKDKRTPKN